MDMRLSALCFLSVAVIGALCTEYPPPPAGLRGPELDQALREALHDDYVRTARATANQKWLSRVEEYARAQMGKSLNPQPFRIDLPLAGSDESLPVLVLPVPIYAGSCKTEDESADNGIDVRDKESSGQDNTNRAKVSANVNVKPPAAAPSFDPEDDENDFSGPPTTRKPLTLSESSKPDDKNDSPPTTTRRTFYNRVNNNDDNDFVPPHHGGFGSATRFSSFRGRFNRPQVPKTKNTTPSTSTPSISTPSISSRSTSTSSISTNSPPVRSEDLVKQFRLQQPSAPLLPPAVLPHSFLRGEEVEDAPRAPLTPGTPPLPPRWSRSLLVRGELTVPRADYTEPYTVWWDAASGSSRVEMHGGTSASYCEQLPGTPDRYQISAMSVDKSSGVTVRRCSVAPLTPVPRDIAPPTLPDPAPYNFAGYSTVSGRQVEVWQYRTQEATPKEELSFRHELIVTRSQRGDAVPLSYTVTVDSSVLGPDCDGWRHRYLEVREQEHTAADLQYDFDGGCDETETLSATDVEHRARLQPLREFTLPIRDPRYGPALKRFMSDFQRVYVDDKEEAVRKNLFIQHSRFTSSCNREGGSFEVAVNFLGDRLNAELDVLLGVVLDSEGEKAEGFPHARRDVDQRAKDLPDQFDWRKEGAVSHVRYQGSCSSCWAMAVTGAVEGALWVRTRRLVPLAEQCLVDCAQPYGGHGCGGTWPSHAYDYIKDNGLPALDEYGQHKEKVEKCHDKAVSPVTHISAHVNVTRNSLPALKVAIKEHAPTVVIIDAKAKSFIFYKKGVLFDNRCGKKSPRLNHAVLAVGWGTEGEGDGEYITVKNSWSAAWGEEGYARLQAPGNTCGVLALPSYPRLEDKDVDKRD